MNDSEIKSLLEFPVCYSICIPPIYTCLIGHIICKNCKNEPRLIQCPICESPYSVPTTRCFVAEELSSKLPVKCPHHGQGCLVEDKKVLIDAHANLCAYRPLSCSVGFCNNKLIQFKNVYEHMKRHFPGSITFTGSGLSQVKREMNFHIFAGSPEIPKYPLGIECFGKEFLQWMEVDGGNIWIWVALCGTPEESQLFTTKLTVSNEKAAYPTRITWEGPVHDIRMSAKQVYESRKCLDTNFLTLANMTKPNEGSWDLQIEIFQKE